jgi:hypothetical protein
LGLVVDHGAPQRQVVGLQLDVSTGLPGESGEDTHRLSGRRTALSGGPHDWLVCAPSSVAAGVLSTWTLLPTPTSLDPLQ